LTAFSAYEELPVSLRAAFLSAGGRGGNDSNNYSTSMSLTTTTATTTSACCIGDKAAIRVPPQPPFTSASTSQDDRYLYAVCSIVMSAMQVAYLEHATNTNDNITDAPTIMTIVPTLAPSTRINNTDDDTTTFPPLETQVTYEIAMPASVNADASQRNAAMTDLQTSVDQLAQAVVVSVSVTSNNNNARRRRRRRRLGESNNEHEDGLARRLQQLQDQQAISVLLPTSFGSMSSKGKEVTLA
jgi:hypothetical protein